MNRIAFLLLFVVAFKLSNATNRGNSNASYVRISSGSCEEYGMYTIYSKAICEAAAQELGLKDTSATSDSRTYYPNGCSAQAYYDDFLLINNSPAESEKCGQYTLNCICTTEQNSD